MSRFILIRQSKNSDLPAISEVVRSAYSSSVNSSFINALMKEITFQLIITVAALMFIFMGVPLTLCISAIPIVLIFIYMSIYGAFLMKAAELISAKRPVQCWVAEAYEPFFSLKNPQSVAYKIISEDMLDDNEFELESLQKKIVGTISVSNFLMEENCAWLFRLAVTSKYCQKGIGHALVETVKKWCRSKKYDKLLLAMSECQENSRQLFVSTGFQMKQMYHKQVIGSLVTLLMFQLECDLKKVNL